MELAESEVLAASKEEIKVLVLCMCKINGENLFKPRSVAIYLTRQLGGENLGRDL